jgi:chromosome transmission fidelity protein 1
MPYNMLLLDDLRNSLGIDLTNSVVIFDEAHNIVEAVNHIYSADVSYGQLDLASRCVAEYSARFQSTLTGKNYYYVNILLSVINSLKHCLKADKSDCSTSTGSKIPPPSMPVTGSKIPPPSMPVTGSKILGANDFLFSCGLDNVNMFKLRKHITETNLANKVGGYAAHQAKKRAAAAALLSVPVNVNSKSRKKAHQSVYIEGIKGDSAGGASASGIGSSRSAEGQSGATGDYTQALRSVLALITCLTNSDIDGRIVVNAGTAQEGSTSNSSSSTDSSSSIKPPSIQFILLNPSVHFQRIVDDARSVLLLGGTLQPFTYVKSFLFPRVPENKIVLFACGHVVSKKNILALVASTGPKGGNLEFTHDTRLRPNAVVEVHSALKEINKVVPNGTVVFFSSYQYMGAVVAKWKAMGIYGELEACRPLYMEPREALDSECIWLEYSKRAVADGGNGAMLLCVMGGKLSEGINFSDKLARCVVVIGMPYTDGRDAVLREKLKFANVIENDEKAGSRLYEAMCMRTVNQCIGRSIRHVNDHAAVLLLDRRYSQQRITSQLPMWLNSDVGHCQSFQDATVKLKNFFDSHLT